MRCPSCGRETQTKKTVPASARTDGRVYRRRECTNPACGVWTATFEITCEQVRQWEAMEAGLLDTPSTPSVPLPTVPAAPLADIEAEMEALLAPAVDAIHDALRMSAPNKAKVEVAKFVIGDRREYRRSLAQAAEAGQEAEDPAVKQLAALFATAAAVASRAE